MPRRKFVAGNWKMATTRASSAELAKAVAAGVPAGGPVTVALCPPDPWLCLVADAIRGSGVTLGAQDAHYESDGAFTGETSVGMVKECGCDYVIVGHSERRHGLNESDELLAKKAKAVVGAGLTAIFCIGEHLNEREADQTESVLKRQLTASLSGLSPNEWKKIVIAYEPVWAIGTGKVATPEQAQAAHKFIRDTVRSGHGAEIADALVIQYGGSVKPDNAKRLLHLPDVDGALVGGASLKADSFLAIVEATKAE